MYCNRAFVVALTVLVQSAVAYTCSEEFSCMQLLLLSLALVALALLALVGLVCRRCCCGLEGDDDEGSQYNIVDGDAVIPIWSDGTQNTAAFTGLQTTDQHVEDFHHRQDCQHHDDFPGYEDFRDHENFSVHLDRPHDDVDAKRIDDSKNNHNVHDEYAAKTAYDDKTYTIQSTSFREPNSSDSEYDQSLVESTYNINGLGKVVLRRPAEQLPCLTNLAGRSEDLLRARRLLSGKASFVPTLTSIEERASEEVSVSSETVGRAQSDVEEGGRRQMLEGERRASGTYTTQEGKEMDAVKARRETGPAEEEKIIIARANEMLHLEPLTRMCRTPKHFHKPMLDLSRSS